MNYQERLDCQFNQDPNKCLESPMERSLYEALKTYGVAPIMQLKVGKYFLDLAFPDIKIAVEYDGQHHLESLERIEKDDEREEEILKLGWRIIRVFRWVDHFRVSFRGDTYRELSTDGVARNIAYAVMEVRRENREINKSKDEEKRRIEMIDELKKHEKKR